MTKAKRILISAAVTLVAAIAIFYIFLPPINVQSESFWIFVLSLVIIYAVTNFIIGAKSAASSIFFGAGGKKSGKHRVKAFGSEGILSLGVLIALIIPLAVLILGSFVSSEFFNASKYAGIIEVKEAVFEEDMKENDVVSNIALMDTDSATIIGNRTLGALSDVVSQYELSPHYSQINYKGAPEKLSNLEYAGFFKWLNNHKNGVPGYVMVDPVNISAEYVKLTDPLKYVDSAYFGEDLSRALRFRYPTKIIHNVTFEIDDNGTPYYIVACAKPKVALFGALDINEVITFNPCDGSSEIYKVEDAPAWIDTVFTGYLATEKYDWYGMLSNGFWNSVIGNRDCKVTTDDFGYIMIEDDVWYFTGVTSVTSDKSNIGFIISNARTGEYKFYPVVGAEEYSAMSSAEGEVQEKRYKASFPSLINVSGQATYIMVLKDDAGIVKLYALVNVEHYTVVATGDTQASAKRAYIEKLKQEGIIAPETEISGGDAYESADITVKDVRMAVLDGQSVVYITDADGTVYKQYLANDESLILVAPGDMITVKYTDTSIDRIKQLVSWSAAE
ncbi:MAG: hypothetical protein ACI3XQ_00275 [Eubacteriales bacterium]